MKKTFNIIFSLVLVASVLASCAKDLGFKMATKITTDASTISMGAEQTTPVNVTVTADGDWVVSAPSWITVTPICGSGNGIISIMATANKDKDGTLAAPRNGDVVLSAANGKVSSANVTLDNSTKATVIVKQAGDPSKAVEAAIITCKEFNDLPLDDAGVYIIKGDITSIPNDYYGNFYINDGTAEAYIYGFYYTDPKSGQEYTKNALAQVGLAVGDNVTLKGVRANYYGTIEMKNADYVSHVKSLVSLNETSVSLSAEAADFKFSGKISGANVDITFDTPSWIAFKNISKEGDVVTWTFTAQENEATSARTATIYIASTLNGVTSKVPFTVKQAAGEIKALTCTEFVQILKTLGNNAPLASYGYVKGYVAANNAGGNLNNTISLVDGTGAPESGFILYGKNPEWKVGDEVLVDLSNAVNSPYNGLREIKNYEGEVLSSGNPLTVPEITAAQIADYQGMYVAVKNAKSKAAANTTWVVGGKTTQSSFTDGTTDFVVYCTNYAQWNNTTYDVTKTATLKGCAQVNGSVLRIHPTLTTDVAPFSVKEGGEVEALTCTEFVQILKSLENNAPLASYGYVKGYIAANNAGGNLNNTISLVDGTGAPESGFILYGKNHDEWNIGDEVLINLSNAINSPYNGLREIKNYEGEVISTGNTLTVPEITAAQIADYQGMYVAVKNAKSKAEANTTWVVGGKTTQSNFTDGTTDFVVYCTNYAQWNTTTYDVTKTATLKGCAQVNGSVLRIHPVLKTDVAPFSAN